MRTHHQQHSQHTKTTSVPLKTGNKAGCPVHLLFNIVLEVLATAIRPEEEIEHIQIAKERRKTVFICKLHDNVLRKPQRIYQETIELINEFSIEQDTKLISRNQLHSLYQ